MRLTIRGKVVAGALGLLLLAGLLVFLDSHTKNTGCGWGDEGWTCGSTWK